MKIMTNCITPRTRHTSGAVGLSFNIAALQWVSTLIKLKPLSFRRLRFGILAISLFTVLRYVCPVQGYFENFLVCNYGPSANIWKVKRLSLKDTCRVLCQDTSFCIDLSTDCPDCQDPVYDIAETTCDCPCVDCDQEEGMCPSDPRWMALSNLRSSR